MLRAMLLLPFFALLFALPAQPSCAQQVKLMPVDEAAADISWVRFRNTLINALGERDKRFVLGIIDAGINNGPDVPKGIAEFKKQWEFDADAAALWSELRKILFLGSVYVSERGSRSQQVCAPYVAINWPDQYDASSGGAIISKDVLVKERPAAVSRTLASLSYDLVPVTDWEVADEDGSASQKWVKVTVKAGMGFVPEEQIRSAIEHRACFRRTNAGWKLTVLFAGE